jgi:hypothetical protein
MASNVLFTRHVIQRAAVLPKHVVAVIQLSQPRYQPIAIAGCIIHYYESAIVRSAAGCLTMIHPLLLVMTFSFSSVLSSRAKVGRRN